MATLTVQAVSPLGTVHTLAAAAGGGDKMPPGNHNFLVVKNGDAGSHTVTINSVPLSNFGTDEDLVVAVAAGVTKLIGPLPANRFAGTDGLVAITYDGVTSVTVAAVEA